MHSQYATVRVKLDRFDELALARGLRSDLAIAKELKISHTTVGRLRKGRRPGGRFIAAALVYFEVPFADLFDQEPEREVAS